MKKKKNLNFTDIALIAVGITTVIFIITMIILFWRFQMVPDGLINNYFKAVFGEISIAGILTCNKRKYSQYDTDEEETDDEDFNYRRGE